MAHPWARLHRGVESDEGEVDVRRLGDGSGNRVGELAHPRAVAVVDGRPRPGSPHLLLARGDPSAMPGRGHVALPARPEHEVERAERDDLAELWRLDLYQCPRPH